MSDSGGFMDSITSAFNSAIDKAKSMMGSTPAAEGATPTPAEGATPAADPPTEPSMIDKYLSFIPADVRDYLTIAIKIIIPLLFAMIVANEMIIYKPSVRLFYFILTWILCFLFGSFRWIIVMYYVLRLIFNKYKKSEGAGGGFFPTIYALLPWSTDIETIRPFRYLTLDIGTQSVAEAFQNKSFQKELKNAYYLGEKMVEYFNVLESADPYRGYGKIYDENFATVKKSIFEMHMPALEIDHENKQYVIELRRTPHKDDIPAPAAPAADGTAPKEDKEIIEYIQIGEHSIKPPVTPNKALKDKKPLYAVTYNKFTNAFTMQDNDALTADTKKKKERDDARITAADRVRSAASTALSQKRNEREAETKRKQEADAKAAAEQAVQNAAEPKRKQPKRIEERVSSNNAKVATGLLSNNNSSEMSNNNSSGLELTSLRDMSSPQGKSMFYEQGQSSSLPSKIPGRTAQSFLENNNS
jgi:hypothetical protein